MHSNPPITPSAEEGIYLGTKQNDADPVCCNNCVYFANRTITTHNVYGYCHRNAPRLVENHTDKWPLVMSTDWCGEHPAFDK